MKKVDEHIFQGMQRDVSVSKQQSQFLWDADNIRLTARDGDTLLSVTNEKGIESAKNIQNETITVTGRYMGHCVLGGYLTVFTTSDSKDYIYRIEKGEEGKYIVRTLYGDAQGQGKLDFNPEYPLQTLGIYENEKIQKVYWTDSINQPRVINICKSAISATAENNYNSNSFDFVPEMQLNDSIKIQKISDSSGMFPAGMIQYAVSYFNKYGQQSNISCVSPLLATSFLSRAGSPEEKISNSFRVTILNPDTNFEYLRLYSIMRTSLNGTPICKRVADVRLTSGLAKYILSLPAGAVTREIGYYYQNVNTDIYISEGSSYTSLGNYSNLIENGIKPHGITNPGNFYHFSRSDFEKLIIRVGSSSNYTYYTWDDSSDIYISRDTAVGSYGEKYYILPPTGKHLLKITGGTPTYISNPEGNVTITDNWAIGDIIDPQELLYIGGESVTAETIEAKDGTLFLGGIKLAQTQLEEYKGAIQTNVSIATSLNTRTVSIPKAINGSSYVWGSSLNACDSSGYATNPAGFKKGEHYRLGVQFQYKNGKWSEPIYLPNSSDSTTGSWIISTAPTFANTTYTLPQFKGTVGTSIAATLLSLGYKRVRGVVVFPTAQDRLILAQGVLNPTVASYGASENHAPDYQSSWFFRPWITGTVNNSTNNTNVEKGAVIQWKHQYSLSGYKDRGGEIQGIPNNYSNESYTSLTASLPDINIGFSDDAVTLTGITRSMCNSLFFVDQRMVTMHSPEFEFDNSTKTIDLNSYSLGKAGYIQFSSNIGDIDIQTSTPTIGKEGSGFVHKTLYNPIASNTQARKLCAGLFYKDWLVDENKANDNYREYIDEAYEFGFMVYPWHKSGSLNNDCIRPANAGVRTAVLKRKIISNLSYAATTTLDSNPSGNTLSKSDVKIFDSEQVEVAKVGGMNYYGNIDTVLNTIAPYGTIFSNGGKTSFTEDASNYSKFEDSSATFWVGTKKGMEATINGTTYHIDNTAGKENKALCISKESIRMKYKSSPHAVALLANALSTAPSNSSNSLYVAELYRNAASTDFGGTGNDAIRANNWIPAGDPVELNGSESTIFYWSYGDTYYQRYDCLKTYCFTPEDENQIVEIGSFMVETHVNIDGRYDKNRGLDSNLYMSPQNFNLINPVYSQQDNFFTYRIMDSDFYKLNSFPATISWTTVKNNAQDVDSWTTVTMGSTLDVDGTMGKVTCLKADKDILYCFQERGISQILFNSRVQIPASDGVPIEISNNYKVDGNRYISNSIGCYNKFALTKSPLGIYFVDGIGNDLYLLQGQQLANISESHGMGYWFSQLDTQTPWTPAVLVYGNLGDTISTPQKGIFLTYDETNNDLYVVTPEKALCYSESLQQFVSFMDYEGAASMFNVASVFHALTTEIKNSATNVKLWSLFKGKYNWFFTGYKPSTLTFVSNADTLNDKIFTNLETRVDFYNGDELQHNRFFDTIRVWNEYQDTDGSTIIDNEIVEFTTVLNHKYYPYTPAMLSVPPAGVGSNTKKKFRIWRVDIPRSTKEKTGTITENNVQTSVIYKPRGNDRIRNTWCKVKLTMNNLEYMDRDGSNNPLPLHMEMHDIGVIYYV